ncbi:hypothetical protein [Bacillus sp. REN16]|uniref:hypothetical protein n=1 Tax=Bacillus sp. REN16 TaxID=2887296 RepID=UPI001E3C4E97|nr:hypothetical protein [Bacillus sp. REN16]MCC3357750.1 hypothetical protein [Bacillus sp. REN16]
MRKMDFSELNETIFEKKSEVERTILRTKSSDRLFRTRPRDEGEAKILDELCIQRWKKAEEEGKIKYISKRMWDYELD